MTPGDSDGAAAPPSSRNFQSSFGPPSLPNRNRSVALPTLRSGSSSALNKIAKETVYEYKGLLLVVKQCFAYFSIFPKSYSFCMEETLDTSLLDKLEIQLNSVEALLSDAEEKLIEDNTRVDKWRRRRDGILSDVPGFNKVRTNIIDLVEINNSVKDKLKYKLKGIHPFKKVIEEELNEIIKRLQFIAAQKDVLGLKEKQELATYRKGRLSTSLANETSTIYGRYEDKETIIRLINSREGNDDAVRIIPIVGMGGIGKTTLASMVFHEHKSEDNESSDGLVFEVKGWTCVSDEFDATRVIKSILESITGQESKSNNNLELLQQELKINLQGKRFLIVLDDLWSENRQDWDVLKPSFTVGAPGSRVIVTTRSEKVAHIVCTRSDLCHKLDKLGEDESWSLFEMIVFSNESSSAYPKLKDIGKKIVSKCKGLPLAIKMIGGLLVSNGYDENEWRNVLNDKICENTNIIPSLRLSYFYLSLGVQSCFAYCSIFPKDYLFSMEQVIMLWVGEGLIEKFCEGNQYEDVARAYFTHLHSKFFFQESSSGGSKFVMHDLVHDLALHVSRGLWVDFRNITVQSRRLCYLQGKDESLLNNMSGLKLNRLRTFLPVRGNFYYGGFWFGVGLYFKKKLLEICGLVNLRHLAIDGTNFKEMPDGIGRMTNIRTLSNYVIGRGKSNQMREFELLNLQGKLHISGLNNVKDANDVVIAGFKQKEILEELVLEWQPTSEQDEKVLDAIEAHKNLRSLTIKGYSGKRLSDWIVGVSPSFTAMVSLCTANCFNGEALPSLGNLPFLKYLEMRSLDRLEYIGEEFYGDSHDPFQALEKLNIGGMKELKTWRFPGGGDKVAFQVLEHLQIRSCPQLTKIPYCFPSLSRLLIESCNNLVKFEMCGEEGSSYKPAYLHPFKSIRICWCPELEEIPNSFANSENFDIKDCKRLVSVPRLQHVRKLKLRDVGVSSLPLEAAVLEELTIQSTLSDLFSAEIHHFTSLKSWGSSCQLDFTFYGGASLDGHAKILTELSNLQSVTKLQFFNYALESFPDVQLPSTLKSLRVEGCSAIRSIPDRFLSGCSKSLQELWVFRCRNLKCLPSTLSTLESLQMLHIYGCDSIHRWPSLSSSAPNYLTNLSDLKIYNCGALECLPDEFHKATTLRTFDMDNCPNLCISEDGFPTNLRNLRISRCVKMKPFVKAVLPTLTSLTHLVLRGFPDIRSLDHCLPESLVISRFPRLKSLTGVLPNLKHLTRLTVFGCPRVDPKSWS
uniref:NB-ARC domain-containing protein n=1 Tax=Kalanchoe fedtschenkoi TaxID=63787 RepID=A0A7N0SWC5_KALFE